MPLEIERKFLIKAPLSLKQMRLVWLDATDVDHINQFYLNSEKGITRRLRTLRNFGSDKCKYIYTVKKNIAPGINEENEKEISGDEFEELARRSNVDYAKSPLFKTRYTFDYNDQMFELDVFEEELEGLIVLEIELDHMDDEIELPSFLNVIKEVTLDKAFRNSKLAKSVRNNGRQAIKLLGIM